MSVPRELSALLTGIGELAENFGDIKPKVALYDGRFAAADIQKISFKRAAIFLSCARTVPESKNLGVAEIAHALGKPAVPAAAVPAAAVPAATVWQQRADFAAAIVVDKTGKPPQQTAWRIAEGIVPHLQRRAAQNLQVSNAYTDSLWQKGMFMLVITWSKQLQVAVLPQRDDITPTADVCITTGGAA